MHISPVRLWLRLIILTSILLGCAHAPSAVEEMATAEVKVLSAVNAGAEEFAPQDLKQAQECLLNAREALENGKYKEANKLIEKSILLSTLAEAQAGQRSAKKKLEQLKDELKQLQKEKAEAETGAERARELLFK